MMRRLLVSLTIVAFMAGLGSVLPSMALGAANDVPGTPLQLGQTVSGNLDSTTKPNDVYSITLAYGQQVELTVSNAINHTGNTMWLLPPSTKTIADASSLNLY